MEACAPRFVPTWSKIPHDVIRQCHKTGPHAMCVLLALSTFTDVRGKCWPSLAAIQKVTGFSRRGVQRAIQQLRLCKLITVRTRQADGRRTSNCYCVKCLVNQPKVGRSTDTLPASLGHPPRVPGTPELEPVELAPEELEALDHVFVSLRRWQDVFCELITSLPRGTIAEDQGFVGQLAWLVAGGAKIWPQVRDAIAGAKMVSPQPDRPIAYIRKILAGTVGRETLLAFLRRAPTRAESRMQLPSIRREHVA